MKWFLKYIYWNEYDFEYIWFWKHMNLKYIYFGNEDWFQMFWMKMIFKAIISRTENPSGFEIDFKMFEKKNTIFESICEYYFEMIWHFGKWKFWCMLSMTDNSIAKRMDCEMSYPCEVLLIFFYSLEDSFLMYLLRWRDSLDLSVPLEEYYSIIRFGKVVFHLPCYGLFGVGDIYLFDMFVL